MARSIVSRRPAHSSQSKQSPDETQGSARARRDSFDDLSRRLLVTVSHIKLVSQHFGDFSGLSLEDSYAGMTLHEAAQDLDALYNEVDTWYVQHEHRPKAPDTTAEVSRYERLKGRQP
jgi:hypothetical protein